MCTYIFKPNTHIPNKNLICYNGPRKISKIHNLFQCSNLFLTWAEKNKKYNLKNVKTQYC